MEDLWVLYFFLVQTKETLKTIIREFHTGDIPWLIKRDLAFPLDSGKIISLIGPRRSGKTYLFYQHILSLLEKGIQKEKILYLNLEDERLDLSPQTSAQITFFLKEANGYPALHTV